MLSKQQIQALKNGAYGVMRYGYKAKYVGETISNYHLWLLYRSDNTVGSVVLQQFSRCYAGKMESDYDIVGLWEDKPEPFNLERALNGAPIISNDGEKAVLFGESKFCKNQYVVEYEKGNPETSTLAELERYFTMYKAPKLSAENLPQPIRDFGDLEEVWCPSPNIATAKYDAYRLLKGSGWSEGEIRSMTNGLFYATEEDCQKICGWIMGR